MKMKERSFLRILSLVIMVVIFVSSDQLFAQTAKTAFEQKLYQAALKEGELNWWDQYNLKEIAVFMDAFNKRYPGIKINYFEGTTDVLAEKYFAEYKAGRANVDATTAGSHLPFKKENLLTDLSEIIKDAKFPSEACTKELTGAYLDVGVYGVAYNTNLVSQKDIPRSWEDLLNPKWDGKLNVESRFKAFIFGTEYWGEKWTVDYLKKLRQQKPTFSRGITNTLTLLGAGEFSIAVNMYLHMVLVMQERGAPVDFAPISPAITGGSSPIIVPKTAPHPNAGRLLVRWLISSEGQTLTDKIFKKGNPMPGTGTIQSKVVERLGIKIFDATDWAWQNQSRLEKLYSEAIGFKK